MQEEEDQEITIFDIIDFLRKYFIFICALTIVFTLAAFIYVSLQKSVYGYRGVIKIPISGNSQGTSALIMSPEALKETILGLSHKNREHGKLIKSVDTLRRVNDLVEFEAHAPTLDEAKGAINQIFNDLLESYSDSYEAAKLERNRTKERLEVLFELLQKEASKISTVTKGNDAQSFLAASQFSSSIATLASLIESFKTSMVGNFELISVTSLGKVDPKPKVMVGIGFVLGVLISFLAALGLDVLKKYKIYLNVKR